MTNKLPAKSSSERMGTPAEQEVKPGHWWVYEGAEGRRPDFNLKPGALPPELPLTLLVQDVRIHDGTIHSIHLARHPSWVTGAYRGMEPIKIMADDFFRDYCIADQDAALAMREREIARLMGHVTETTTLISRGPDHEEVLALSAKISAQEKQAAYKTWRDAEIQRIWKSNPAQETGRAMIAALPAEIPDNSPTGNLPAALLPSGDVLAVQKRIEGEVLKMKAHEAWISQRTEEMKDSFSVLGDFQTEKVTAVTSSISDRVSQAHELLNNVRTMRLFLGQGAGAQKICSGASADPSEPLHLMQRMLYLDEEIFVADQFFGGFNGGDLRDLGTALAKNPHIIRRMLPHPRSVVITKARRKAREFEWGSPRSLREALAEVFKSIEQKHEDGLIQILVRDGDNVHMIVADEDTSKAERLFPSRVEIDRIYSKGGQEITPHDIEYSDHRNEHDARALFYKRFLIILWGLHEREGVFGDFMPKGENWLQQSVASERFRFVHDEENVLTTGRPSVADYLDDLNSRIRPGSLLMIETGLAVTPDTAPTIYKSSPIDRFRSDATRYPMDNFILARATRRGNEIVVDVPTLKAHSYRNDDKAQNTPVTIVSDEGWVSKGVLCIEEASSQDLLYYAESRLARASCLEWLRLFHEALPHIRSRETAEAPAIAMMEAHGIRGGAARKMLAFSIGSKRIRPEPDAEAGFAAARLAQDLTRESHAAADACVLVGSATGELYEVLPHPGNLGVMPNALILRNIAKNDDIQIEGRAILERNMMLLKGRQEFIKLVKGVKRNAQPGFTTVGSLKFLESFDNGPAFDILTGERVISDEGIRMSLELFAKAKTEDGYITFPRIDHLLAVAALPKVDGSYGIASTTKCVVVRECVLSRLIAQGHEDQVADALRAKHIKSDNIPKLIERLRENPYRVVLSDHDIPTIASRNGILRFRLLHSPNSRDKNDLSDIEAIFLNRAGQVTAEQRQRIRENAIVFAAGREDDAISMAAAVLRDYAPLPSCEI